MSLCYKCRYRGDLPGDTHSCCRYPGVRTSVPAILDKENTGIQTALGITADRYGFSKGWFFWPANFDPVWLLSCKGFTPKEEKNT